MSSPIRRGFVAAVVTICGLVVAAPIAHKTIVSPFTFHRDVAPILRERCGSCHVEGGNTFPLTTYADVKAQAWKIQMAVVSGRMPVWYGEAQAAPFKGSRAITAKEINVLMTWGAGSAPEGVPVASKTVPAVGTPLGRPHTILEMPEAVTVNAVAETEREIVWPAGALEGKWIQAADLLAGAPAIVRRATIAIRSGDREQVVTQWIPGDLPQSLPGGGAYQLPAGSSIVLRVHDKPVSAEARTIVDRSRVALWIAAPAAARSVGTLLVSGKAEWQYLRTDRFMQPIESSIDIAALSPLEGPLDGSVALTVIAPDGRRRPLARIGLRPEWPRRYVFTSAIHVEAGSRIEAAVTPSYGLSLASLTGDRMVNPDDGSQLRVLIETIR